MTKDCSERVAVAAKVLQCRGREAKAGGSREGAVAQHAVSGADEDSLVLEAADGLRAAVEFEFRAGGVLEHGEHFVLIICKTLEDMLCAQAFERAVNMLADRYCGTAGGFLAAPGYVDGGCCKEVCAVFVYEAGDAEVMEELARGCKGEEACEAYRFCRLLRFEGLEDFKERFHGVHGSTHGGGAQGGREVAV